MIDVLTDQEQNPWARRQFVLAELGRAALDEEDSQILLDQFARRAAEVFDAECVRIIEVSGDNECLKWRAGTGWRNGLIGSTGAGKRPDSQIGYLRRSAENGFIIIDDLKSEKRFAASAELLGHQVVSGISAIIGNSKSPFGELGVYSTKKRSFDLIDGLFLASVANILTLAIERNAAEKNRIENAVGRIRPAGEKTEAASDGSPDGLPAILENLKDCVVITLDNEGRIQNCNEGARSLFGFTDDEATGKSAELLFTTEDRKKEVLFGEFGSAKKKGSLEIEGWQSGKDGAQFFLGGVLSKLNDDGSGFLYIGRDLTERKKTEDELRRSRGELESRVKDRKRELGEANKILKKENKQRRKAEKERRQLMKQLVTTLEKERRRIARDLHDYLGQQLTAIRLNLKSLRSVHRDESVLKSKILEAEQIAGQMDSDISFLAWQLRPAALDDLGLRDALVHFVEEWSRHFGKKIKIHTGTFKDGHLLPEVETHLYRIAQELLNNIVKHSHADRVSVLLEKNLDELVLIVEDDGIGFDYDKVARKKKSLGLIGVRERAALIGGTIEIESAPKKGTTVFVHVPNVL